MNLRSDGCWEHMLWPQETELNLSFILASHASAGIATIGMSVGPSVALWYCIKTNMKSSDIKIY